MEGSGEYTILYNIYVCSRGRVLIEFENVLCVFRVALFNIQSNMLIKGNILRGNSIA